MYKKHYNDFPAFCPKLTNLEKKCMRKIYSYLFLLDRLCYHCSHPQVIYKIRGTNVFLHLIL